MVDIQNLHTDPNKYELGMGSWSKLLAVEFLGFVGPSNPQSHVLDIGCGTGSLTFAIAEASQAAQIIGIDRSLGYLKYARANNRYPYVTFALAEALKLPFDDNAFDYCLAALVIQFVPDTVAAINEMLRVTRRGGVVATCVWDSGGGMELSRRFWQAAAAVDAGAKRPDSPYKTPMPLTELWHAAGLSRVECRAVTITVPFLSFEDYWQRYSNTQGPAKPYLASLSEERKLALKNQLHRDLLGDTPDGPIHLTAQAWAVKGTVQ